jgi:curved DNA-binding protein CbpA
MDRRHRNRRETREGKAWDRRAILAYLDRVEPILDRLNYFELLDVQPDATPVQIQEAFHAVAAGIHPDRLRKSLTAEEKERLTIVYARIAEAYRVLRDEDSRNKYLVQAARAEDAQEAPSTVDRDSIALLSPRAQSLYGRAEAALRTGDRASALLNLRMALALHPQSTLLREALARAQGKSR